MSDLIFITAHCPTEEQELELERCINSVQNKGFDIALLSHTHIPIHLQKKCQFYFFDYLNDVSDDVGLMSYNNFIFDKGETLYSRFFQKNFYGFAIYRMFSIASNIASNFGYENIHHIEYDCRLLDINLIHEHKKLLEEYDSVLYTDDGTKDGFMFGSIKSFKVKSLPDGFKTYNREVIENEIKKMGGIQLEYFTKNLFIKSGRVHFSKEPSHDRFERGKDFYHRNIHYTLYYKAENNTMNIFYHSRKDIDEKITVITNGQKILTINVKPNFWYVRTVGDMDQIRYVRIDNGIKIIYEKDFTDEYKKIFKVKSYIKNEKNN